MHLLLLLSLNPIQIKFPNAFLALAEVHTAATTSPSN